MYVDEIICYLIIVMSAHDDEGVSASVHALQRQRY